MVHYRKPRSGFIGRAAFLGLAAASLLACTGSISSPDSTGAPGPTGRSGATPTPGVPGQPSGSGTPTPVASMCKTPSPGRAPMRRLSSAEYRNTVTDLFAQVPGIAAMVAPSIKDFPADPDSLGFQNSADFLVVQSLGAQKYLDAAEQLAQAAAQAPNLVTCPATPDDKCAGAFARTFGKRAFRRPLSATEAARFDALYAKAAAAGYDFKTGVEWIVFAILQSPQFLYRVELGAPPKNGLAKPSPYEMATRLSYLLWQSMPDDALFAAAEANQLDTPAQIEVQARRLLADPKAGRVIEYFDEWMDLDVLQDKFARDPVVYKGLNPALPSLLRDETHAFVSSLLKDPNGGFEQLLSAPYTFMNKDLAAHYKASGPTTATFERVEQPGRSGVLTQGMLLGHDKATRTSIVLRGLKVRTDLLCQIVPAPPGDVPALDAIDPKLPQRQRLERHRTDPSCSGCHTLMDPIGVAFEGFDAVGRTRTVDENGVPVDTATTLSLTEDADGPVASAVDLGKRLARSEQARRCYVTNSFRFFYGREVEAADMCSMAQIMTDFKKANYSLSSILTALTKTDAFLYRSLPEVQP